MLHFWSNVYTFWSHQWTFFLKSIPQTSVLAELTFKMQNLFPTLVWIQFTSYRACWLCPGGWLIPGRLALWWHLPASLGHVIWRLCSGVWPLNAYKCHGCCKNLILLPWGGEKHIFFNKQKKQKRKLFNVTLFWTSQ